MLVGTNTCGMCLFFRGRLLIISSLDQRAIIVREEERIAFHFKCIPVFASADLYIFEGRKSLISASLSKHSLLTCSPFHQSLWRYLPSMTSVLYSISYEEREFYLCISCPGSTHTFIQKVHKSSRSNSICLRLLTFYSGSSTRTVCASTQGRKQAPIPSLPGWVIVHLCVTWVTQGWAWLSDGGHRGQILYWAYCRGNTLCCGLTDTMRQEHPTKGLFTGSPAEKDLFR